MEDEKFSEYIKVLRSVLNTIDGRLDTFSTLSGQDELRLLLYAVADLQAKALGRLIGGIQ